MSYLLRVHWFAAIFAAVCACASFVGYAVAKANPLVSVVTDRVMAQVDVDGDGRVTRDEFADARGARFLSADTNGDGYVTRDEFRTELTSIIGELGLVWADQFFAVMDRDGDGLLAEDEVDTLAETVFAQMDRDGDGVVTPAEVRPSLAMAQ